MTIADRHKKKEEEREIERRVYNRNTEAMTFCNNNGLVIYPSAQAHNSNALKLFVQKDSKYKPLSDIEYDQTKKEDVHAYIAAIDKEYERLYIKMKDRDNINK